VKKCALEWASLPTSPYGQPTVTMAQARAEYEQAGGHYAEAVPPQPFLSQEQPVAPFIAAALPAVLSAVPELLKIFGKGDEKSERTEKAATVVMEVAKAALGAKNEQEVVDTLGSDPSAATVLRQAVQDNWFQLVEVGGGIQAAREANAKAQGDKGISHNPAVWVSAALLIFPLLLAVDVFFVHPSAYDGNLRTQIVTGLLAVILMVGGYWLGTSASSAKKDEALARR
jgi:hypothetical protein